MHWTRGLISLVLDRNVVINREAVCSRAVSFIPCPIYLSLVVGNSGVLQDSATVGAPTHVLGRFDTVSALLAYVQRYLGGCGIRFDHHQLYDLKTDKRRGR